VDEQLREIIDVDRVVHEPARLAILAVLWAVESADFLYLLHATDLTRGNLSSHLSKLEDSGYVEIEKTFEGKMPRTLCRLTDSGQEAFESYREQMRTFLAG
jgi:DNA-binding MarR family transcriptional regulator